MAELLGAERTAMRRACDLARQGATSPNPRVGCVLLDPVGAVIGEGWHHAAGRPHAEVEALRDAWERADGDRGITRGATAVVTLEPCDHVGRTGPCTEALIDAGIARVVIGTLDPTERSGDGVARLRGAGIEVVTGVEQEQAERAAREWLTWGRTGRPHVTWKVAQSLDGHTAAPDGSSRWITGPQARDEVHALRAQADAVLVGTGTLRADDPHLAVRRGPEPLPREAQPLRVVLDAACRISPAARVLDDAAPTLVVVGRPRLADPGAAAVRNEIARRGHEVYAAPLGPDGRLDLAAILTELGHRGVRSVLVEGGAHLAGALLDAGLVDRVVAYLAPLLLGGGAPSLVSGAIGALDRAVHLQLESVAQVGPDLRVDAVITPKEN